MNLKYLLVESTQFEREYLYLQINNNLRKSIMARPILETPILRGKDAERFMANFNDPQKKETITDEERKRMRENFEKINDIIVIQ